MSYQNLYSEYNLQPNTPGTWYDRCSRVTGTEMSPWLYYTPISSQKQQQWNLDCIENHVRNIQNNLSYMEATMRHKVSQKRPTSVSTNDTNTKSSIRPIQTITGYR